MNSQSATHKYHIIKFDNQVEAAAFIAALSRFLNYPQGSVYRSQADSIEVWFQSIAINTPVKLYLSDGVLNAAKAAFSPMPVTITFDGENLPNGCMLILGGDQIPSWGLEEAQRHLTRS